MLPIQGGKSLWQVTGRGGLTVRAQCDPKSTKIGTLARKAVFEELDRNCYRIMFKRIEGEGAESGGPGMACVPPMLVANHLILPAKSLSPSTGHE